jgi:hypothetical protein
MRQVRGRWNTVDDNIRFLSASIAVQVYASPLVLSCVQARRRHHWNLLQALERAVGVIYPMKPDKQTTKSPKPTLDPANMASLKWTEIYTQRTLKGNEST